MKAITDLFVIGVLVVGLFYVGVWTMVHGYGIPVKSWHNIAYGYGATLLVSMAIQFVTRS